MNDINYKTELEISEKYCGLAISQELTDLWISYTRKTKQRNKKTIAVYYFKNEEEKLIADMVVLHNYMKEENNYKHSLYTGRFIEESNKHEKTINAVKELEKTGIDFLYSIRREVIWSLERGARLGLKFKSEEDHTLAKLLVLNHI